MHLENRITTVVSAKLKLPGIWGIRMGVAANATQIGIVASADAPPGIIVQDTLKRLNDFAGLFDFVLISQETFDLWDDMSGGLLFESTVEVSGNKGLIEDLNGLSFSGGAGFLVGGVTVETDLESGEVESVGLMVGPTLGVGGAVTATGSMTLIDLVKIGEALGVKFHEETEAQPDGSVKLKNGSKLHKDGTVSVEGEDISSLGLPDGARAPAGRPPNSRAARQSEADGSTVGRASHTSQGADDALQNQSNETFQISDRVSSNNDVEPRDARKMKRVLIELGFLDEPDIGVNGFVDTALLEGIQEFQKQNDLPADGVVKPGGPTEGLIAQALQRRRRNRRSSSRPLNSPQPFSAG